jgi:soluble lytic murein transglycosylase-like protein
MRHTHYTPHQIHGGRPNVTYHNNLLRTTAIPHHAIWVTFSLASLLLVIALWSWTTLQPHLSNLGLLDFRHSDTPLEIPALRANNNHLVHTSDTLSSNISPTFTPEVQYWSVDIVRWASEFGLDPNLVAVVMQIESCGHPSVHSSAGALGLFQVMPYHFNTDDDPFDPQTNAQRGLIYLAQSFELSNGRIDLTLAGYNGGHGVIDHNPENWPAETRRYVRWGTSILDDIRRGEASSPHLEEWLSAGGASLCKRAATILDQ